MVEVRMIRRANTSRDKVHYLCPDCGETMLVRHYPTGEPYNHCPECGLALMSSDLVEKRQQILDSIMQMIEDHFGDYGVMSREDYDDILGRAKAGD